MTSPTSTLRHAVATDTVVVLDGGLSTVLAEAGCDLSSDLWTAALLRDSPDQVVAAHGRYLAAGAQVSTTASYQASRDGFGSTGMSPDTADRLIGDSVRLARRARDSAMGAEPSWVAASVGPYGAALADGSEYRGDYGVTARTLHDFHARRLEVLAAAAPDVLAVETIPDVREAEVLVPLLDDLGIDAWFSYAVADGRTRAGQPLDEAFAVVAGSTSVIAAGVNCCAPDEVLGALHAARAAGVTAGVAYPNQGRVWDADQHVWTGRATFDLDLVPSWIEAGARLVGGCCEVGPDHIAALAASLPR
ncbi:homocysteine S-methyltransferase [Aeromicrobium fastidiosum]|uniref:Homocysteine S-methyltransferase n=1 Tax=Aeromicrobium fastidiosum TaxID=52699 RepID=A0A641APD5_9ACTN|nr:homocysteine S-methyltransferase [Aeromicrobium fastidiosum]KAA1379795.1 homocysteine S-methyltransferase [Aeromicrobium fastidiosum]MBP2389287.1 homocysteine S-methyltransferase [Aeromicrobium fastidiosum]